TEAIADLEAAVQDYPLQEPLHEQLVRALASGGRTAEALEHAYRFRRRLADETGLDPSPRLAALEQDVRQQAPGALPDPAGREPTPRVAAGHRLPQPTTTFIGREDERRQLAAALTRARLVTVTGPGGVGKTRLALEVAAAHSARLGMDSRLCELGVVGEDAAVPHAVAAAVGLSTPPGPSFDEATVIEALRDRDLLLVLDGCEHLVDAVASLAAAILRHCPQVLLLATGRERIGVDGERVLPVAPLAVPPPGAADALSAPATRLFVDRAQAVRPDFDLAGDNADAVAEVCRRLDGLPLAIELAAARASALEPGDLAARLDERFVLMEAGRRAGEPRHRTLRAVVDWSYQLLNDAERRTFTRVSVFAGGFTLPLAEQVVADGRIPQERVAALVSSLVDKSMITVVPGRRPPRYTLLETLRAYGQERLAERGEADAVGRAHARAMAELADRAADGLRTEAEADWVARLDTEVDNLRAAHRWALQAGDADVALHLSAALHRYGYWRLHREVLEWAEAAVGIAAAGGNPALPGALATAGVAAWMRGDLDAADAHAQRGLAAVDADDDPVASALLHEVKGDVATFRGHMDAAAPWFSAAARMAEQAGDEQTAVFNVGGEALVRAYAGQLPTASERATAAHDWASRTANPSALAWTAYVCGEVIGTDEAPRALELLDEGRRTAESVRNEFIVGVADVSAASVRSRMGDAADSLDNFLALIDRWRRSNNWTQQWVTLRNLAESMVRIGEDEAATVLQAAAEAAGASAPSRGAEAARLREAAATAHRRLGPEAYRAADERGRRLTAGDVLQLAVDTIERQLAERRHHRE
ncbi:MAG: ATP-binding protein, partial [Actinomycetota bacterium]